MENEEANQGNKKKTESVTIITKESEGDGRRTPPEPLNKNFVNQKYRDRPGKVTKKNKIK